MVPLEAGAGPENPPCPACAEPLFGWIDARAHLAAPARRCESCGLGVVGDPGGVGEVLATLDRADAGGPLRIVNREGFSAWIGGAGWAGLGPDVRYLFTVESIRRLVANRDQVVEAVRWSPLAAIAAMWQTLVNSATFGHNLAFGSSVPAPRRWQRRIDWVTTVVLALPAILVSLALEPVAAAVGRGGVLSLRLQLL